MSSIGMIRTLWHTGTHFVATIHKCHGNINFLYCHDLPFISIMVTFETGFFPYSLWGISSCSPVQEGWLRTSFSQHVQGKWGAGSRFQWFISLIPWGLVCSTVLQATQLASCTYASSHISGQAGLWLWLPHPLVPNSMKQCREHTL